MHSIQLDIPTIISGEKIAYLDPQEKVWPRRSGHRFTLDELQKDKYRDALTPFVDISQFSRGMSYYPKTLFRFPLRTVPSALSENVYTEQKLEELINALRGEAKLLLPFLRSVSTIEVYKIAISGSFSLSFRVEIATASKSLLSERRLAFRQQLKHAHSSQSYGISSLFHFDADFHVEVTDKIAEKRSGSTHFLLSATVGSTSSVVCNAATKQKVFPWIGTALEVDSSLSHNGRIFCFLPMPVDAASNLPVHVNGTFGLNDDRRSMKWPGLERRNDPTADWNDLLVTQLLPACYVKLLVNAMKHLSAPQFYDAWPDVKLVKGSHWEKILCPLFVELFSHPVLWSERTAALARTGEWVRHTNAFFTPLNEKLPSVLLRALSNCSLKLVTVPRKIWDALKVAKISVSKVTPKLARNQFRSNPSSYSSIDPVGKRVLLIYCIEDKQYSELHGVALLPLANGNYVQFQRGSIFSGGVYLCNPTCPRDLLPNLNHKLVDVSDDSSLQSGLNDVARSRCTQLVELAVNDVATLLPESMPSSWQRCTVVSLNDASLPSCWLENFWTWVRNHNLKLFENLFLLPVGTNSIVRLSANQAVVFVSQYSHCPPNLLSAFDKLYVKYCLQARFSYVQHQFLSHYVRQFNSDSVLDSAFIAGQYTHATFNESEAQALLSLLSQHTLSLTYQRKTVLKSIAVFSTASNSNSVLSSPNRAANGLIKRAVLEPRSLMSLVSKLPSTLILFSCRDYSGVRLLQYADVEMPSDTNFLLKYIFPLIENGTIPQRYIDQIMDEIHQLSSSIVDRDHILKSTLAQLAFVRTASGYRQSPYNLFDPSNSTIKDMYKGEHVFPTEPYNSYKWLQFLRRSCSLRVTVKADEVLKVISKIKLSSKSYCQEVNQTYLCRAKAVLQYISSHTFQQGAAGTYYVPECVGYIPFSTALNYLASNYSWLPVAPQRPTGYPSALTWKGEGLKSHFFTLGTQGAVLTDSNKGWLPYVVGSQMYLTDAADTPSSQLTVNESSICINVINHLQRLVDCYKSIPVEQVSFIVNKIYSFLNRQNQTSMTALRSVENWIYIRKKNVFVGSSVVSLNLNSSFGRDLEPYLFVLPDTLTPYNSLFKRFGVFDTMSQSQIISVLGKIKESINKRDLQLSSSYMWNVVMSILNWLTSNGTEKANLTDKDKLYVPIESDSEWPQLESVSESVVVYTDNDFLKSFLSSSSTDGSFTFVHKCINAKMADCLGLTPLSDFLDITEDTFADTGQYEPLTVRLKNILRDYKEGLTIAKELLQNADDAEASEVNFCYDARTHSVDPNSLFFPDMLPSHGPALIVHNNKCFSKDDFENITKLAGATKQNKPLKIGKFGIGFCSVYHITDVPSFVSSDSLVVFDPTMKYLKREIKNPSRPGKKVKFTSPFIRRSKQLVPYDGLFGFDSQEHEYNGTMFRLPFRSSQSELSGVLYTEDHHIKQLISEMKECCSNLILFLQHVKRITFQVIKPGEAFPTVRLEITKSNLSVPCFPSGTSLKEIVTTSSESQCLSSHFVVSSDSVNVGGKQATASVAASLVSQPSGKYTVSDELNGEVFCFLPLSQKTGLPVHVSANFAVISNRRGIWTSDDASSQLNEEVQWNNSLMQSVIPTAYHQLVLAMQVLHIHSKIDDYLFYSLWPLESSLKLSNPWTVMVKKVYELMATSKVFYSNNKGSWMKLNESKFIAEGILKNPKHFQDCDDRCISDILEHLNFAVVNLPMKYRRHFHLLPFTIDENQFLSIFFKNLQRLSLAQPIRDELILRMLEVYAAEYDDDTKRRYVFQEFLQNHSCIPCSPDGSVLKKCSELIDPTAPFADLFDVGENRFPLTELTDRHLAHTSLLELGVVYEHLSYSEVVERSKTVAQLYTQNKRKAQDRIKLILKTIAFYMKDEEGVPNITLDAVPFLPVLCKPRNYPISWAGDGHELKCGRELMVYNISRKSSAENNGVIAGSQVLFVDESTEGGCGELSKKVQSILKVRVSPTCSEVICHLREIIKHVDSLTVTDDISWVEHMCRQIYKFLNEKNDEDDLCTIQELINYPCVWNGKRFLKVQQIARDWKTNGPYLYPVPSVLSLRTSLCKTLGVKEDFTISEVEIALSKMKEDFGENPVNEQCQLILHELIGYFVKIKPKDISNVKVLLPDENFVLLLSAELAYNDAPWAPKDAAYRYVNAMIPRDTALNLGVRPVRAKLLDKYVNTSSKFRGIEFGQREELTRRIQNILRDYPFDVTVLKELLQNADDAKAKKLCIILDKRSHGTQSVLSEQWQNLQGPAVLVWNDSIFSEKDIEGIQELGLGSKRSEAESIGQYGIGFNSIYHLTDCPSFITNGETLCVMDPHCTFVPGAESLNPGRRYDKLTSGFWDEFQDMKSAYLRSELENLPKEFHGGSLFRLPLRSTYKLLKSSKIVADISSDILNSTKMENLLNQWAPKMKAAMFFLNSVRELKFFVIEENSKVLKKQFHYSIDISLSAQQQCDLLQQKISKFKERTGCETCVVRYPITIIDTVQSPSGESKKHREKWIIQQGIGDIEKHNQTWTFVKNVRPRHGIAASLDAFKASSKLRITVSDERFCGQVFCFLPLPIFSRLPVHVNGHFILNSTRRQLWQSTNPGEEDARTIWNKNLLSALASSYANFIANAQQYYIDAEYTKMSILRDDIDNFYSVFPRAESDRLDKQWLAFAKECYAKLNEANPKVLVTVVQAKDMCEQAAGRAMKIIVEWHPLKSVNPSTQVYFWHDTNEQKKVLQPIFEAVGMLITPAPMRIRRYLKNELNGKDARCPEICPNSVYNYYTLFSSQILSLSSTFPCEVQSTMFKCVLSFKLFTQYILNCLMTTDSKNLEFPKPPFGYPLLLTADNKLRRFDADNKVIHSHFVDLFPMSSYHFLHPKFLDIQYSKKYFIAEDCDYSHIHKILLENVPQSLCDVKSLRDARSVFPIQKLQQLWTCLSQDPVFSTNLTRILKRWALILTTDNRLFSSISTLHPIYPPLQDDQSLGDVFRVLNSIEMPIVDRSVVVSTSGTLCPTLSDNSKVLRSLYYLNYENDFKLSRNNVTVLVKYLSAINYRTEPDSCREVKSLPLFEDIVGNFSSLCGVSAFVWPMYCLCKVGYGKWIRGYQLIFLKPYASWSDLGASLGELGVTNIATEDMYVSYIFPHFHLMQENERYEHLKYIRDNLFYSNNFTMSNPSHVQRPVRQRATSFVHALRTLECIGEDEHPLHCVSFYCDHEKEIFTAFSRHFEFLPQYFTDYSSQTSQWMKFFRALGLKTTIHHDEYLKFCRETASGRVKNVRKSSLVLIKSLFDAEKEWYDYPGFLTQVSQIAFLCCAELPSLTWLSPAPVTSRIQSAGSESIGMTEPAKAALMKCSTVLWTVKPIVVLPDNDDVIKKLSVCTESSTSNIMQNLRNICHQNKFADIGLFDKYPQHLKETTTTHSISMSSIFIHHFELLQGKVSDAEAKILQNIPCIPVRASPTSFIVSDMVLVKPGSVLCCDVSRYHPFLHKLPSEFTNVTPLLAKIGVQRELSLKHIQVVLQAAYDCSGGKELEMNTRTCVHEAVKLLYKLLKNSNEDHENKSKCSDEEILNQLSPLYLPGRNKALSLSTDLLYHDAPYFNGKRLNLKQTRFTELDISYHEYFFYRSYFCSYLPRSIRPKGTSELCTAKVSPDCQQCDHSDFAKRLSTTLKMNILPKSIATVVKHTVSKDITFSQDLQTFVESFLQKITVLCYKDLKIVIILNEKNTIVGDGKVQYFLEKNESMYTLSLDIAIKDTQVSHMYTDIVNLFISVVQTICNSQLPACLQETFGYLLRAQSASELIGELQTLCLPVAEIAANENIELTIGMEIHHDWHYRLDQDVDNLFHANEFVGYEDEEGHFILVMIVHAVSSEDPINTYTRKFKVFTSENDEDGVEVSVLSLYKFVRGAEKVKASSDFQSVVPYAGKVSSSTSHLSDLDLTKIKKELCRELKAIWGLEEKDRKRALRRLYLKWHPDKNPDNPAFTEKVYKFLRLQIQKLQQGLPLDDPDNEDTTMPFVFTGNSSGSGWWRQFREWDYTASQHRSSARDYERSTPKGGNQSSGSYYSPFTAGDKDFRVPRQPEEGRRWLRQAAVDKKALIVFYDQMISLNDATLAGHVCFLAHQLAEKTLKAGMYAICGLDSRSLNDHALNRHACALQTEKPVEASNLLHHADSLEHHYVETRYPNRHWPPTIPADVYSLTSATEAKEHAIEIFITVSALFDN